MPDIYEIVLEAKVAHELGKAHQRWFALIIGDFWR